MKMKNRRPHQTSSKARVSPRPVEPLESRLLMTVFTVTNTNDSGAGSLRDAINLSNNTGGFDTIAFNISGASKVIHVGSELPGVYDAAIVDGTTQPGYAGKPLVQIDGSGAGSAVGLKLFGSSTVKGLSITGFNGDGVNVPVMRAGYTGNTIQANWIGVDLAGNLAGNNAQGVGLYTSGNLVGGPNVADRNIISGSKNGQGVYISGSGATNNIIQNNYIGTDPTGTSARANAHNGVGIQDAPNNKVLNNLISGNTDDGIILIGVNASGSVVQGNIVGLDVTGANVLSNHSYGIEIQSANNTIGGATAAMRNIFSGNFQSGIVLFLGNATNNLIQNNYIGTDITGNLDRGNTYQGIAISSSNSNTIKDNLISGNNAEGVGVFPGNNNSITGNVIGFAANGSNLPNSTWPVTLINGSTGNVVTGNYVATHPSGGIYNGGQNTVSGNFSTPPSGVASVPGSFSFSASNYSFNENAGTVTLTVNRSANTNIAASVNYATSNGTATSGSDYTATSGTLSFAAGETSKTFTVNIINDSVIESDETVNLSLSGATAGATIVGSGAVLTIVNDDVAIPGAFTFSASSYSAGEAAGTATITVNRTANTNVAAAVNYATSNGTATSGSDYTAASGTLNFAAGETSKTFTIAITNDTAVEADETINLALSNATAGATIGTPATAVLTIVNDDQAPADTTPPAVTSAAFSAYTNGQKLVYTFSENVGASISVEDATITDSTTAATYRPISAVYDYTTNTATFNFGAQLPRGNYRASLLADTVTDAAGNHLDGNGDSRHYGTHTFAFSYLPADANHDGVVDFNDLTVLAQNYNTSGKTLSQGDFNYDGVVDFNDLVLLSQNYNTAMPVAGAPAVQAAAKPVYLLASVATEPVKVGPVAPVKAASLKRPAVAFSKRRI